MAQQTLQNVARLHRDMRANAVAAKVAAKDSVTPNADIVEVTKANVRQYLRRLKWQEDIEGAAERRQRLARGLQAVGITDLSAYRADIAVLRSAAMALDAITVDDLAAKSDDLLSTVPAYDQVWE
jgi:PleD family two-component response regulator